MIETRQEDRLRRRLEVEQLLDEIVDPCSGAVGTPIGLLQMGIVESIGIDTGDVSIRLLPTFPGCIFTGVFAEEIERRLGRLPWVEHLDVEIVVDGSLWDEERMHPVARERLQQARGERRRRMAELLEARR